MNLLSGGAELRFEKMRVFTVDQDQLRRISRRKLEGNMLKIKAKSYTKRSSVIKVGCLWKLKNRKGLKYTSFLWNI